MKANICVLAGDGVGPEVTAEAERVLRSVASRFSHAFAFRAGLIGGAAIDAAADPFPAETRALVAAADAVLLGAVGGPRWSDPAAPGRPEQGLLALRAAMNVYANLRPVQPHESLLDSAPLKRELLVGVDVLFVRELTGGMYFGEKTLVRRAGGSDGSAGHPTWVSGLLTRSIGLTRPMGLRVECPIPCAAGMGPSSRDGVSESARSPPRATRRDGPFCTS